jgi:hypothetical protein
MGQLQQHKGWETAGCPDLLERAFQLAYFIVQDRAAAIEIVATAKKRLAAEQARERKRAYWRNKPLKQKIRRMTRDEQDALQWLIYLESERYEIQQEQEGTPDERAMGVRYIKFLVQMTVNMSSFYVAVGLHRILHRYSTPEVQQAYELLTEEYAGAEKYRRVKQQLMRKVAERFGKFITITRSDNQELRFEPYEDQRDWVDLATRCLKMFTPWSTVNACWFRSVSGIAESGPRVQGGPDTEEMRRCHVFIHPPCFDRLAKTLGLSPRRETLAMPHFKMTLSSQDHPHLMMASAVQLTTEEREFIDSVPKF